MEKSLILLGLLAAYTAFILGGLAGATGAIDAKFGVVSCMIGAVMMGYFHAMLDNLARGNK